MNRCLKGTLLGGLAFFIWMNVSWMMIGWHQAYMSPVPNVDALSAAIKTNVTEKGLYFIPFHKKGGDQEAFQNKMSEGPFAKMVIYPDGKPFNMGKMMLFGFLISCLIASLLTCLLTHTSGLSLMKKVMFCEVAGMVGALQIILSNWNWWGYPCLYVIVMTVDLAISFSLVGLVLGKFVVKD